MFVNDPYWLAYPDHLAYWNKETFIDFLGYNSLKLINAYGDYPIEHLLLEDSFNYKKNIHLGKPAHSLRCKVFNYLVQRTPIQDFLGLLKLFYTCNFSRSFTYVLSATHD